MELSRKVEDEDRESILLQEEVEVEFDDENTMEKKAQIMMHATPPRSHQSIGGAEGGHGRGVGFVRTFIAELEDKYDVKPSGKHVIMAWIVRHAGFVFNRFGFDKNWIAPYKELKKQVYDLFLMSLVEKVS